MITLLTGVPGHGKTLYTVSKIAERYAGRPFFYHRIKELTLDWQHLDDPNKWMDCPPNSVIVLDEIHEYWPKRDGKTPTPQAIEKLRVHRSDYGLDIVLITQDPAFIDIDVRRVVGEHLHFERKFNLEMSTIYNFGRCCDLPYEDKEARAKAFTELFKFPKSAYGTYKSAPAHTMKKKLPKKLLLLPVAIAVTGFLVYSAYDTLIGKNKEPVVANQQIEEGAIKPVPLGQGSPGGPARHLTAAEYVAFHEPRIPGLAHTAPAYDEVTQVRTAPIPKACVASATRCTCYTDQATPLNTGDDLCREIAAHGFYDPTAGEPVRNTNASPPVANTPSDVAGPAAAS